MSASTAELRGQWFRDERAFGTVLLALMIDANGEESLQWDPATRRAWVEDLPGEHSEECLERLSAAAFVATSNRFFRDGEAFNHTCRVLFRDEVDAGDVDTADPTQLAWGMTEAAMLRPDHPKYSEDVGVLIEMSTMQYGYGDLYELFMQPMVAAGTLDESELGPRDEHDDATFLIQSDRDAEIGDTVHEMSQELISQLDRAPILSRGKDWSKQRDKLLRILK